MRVLIQWMCDGPIKWTLFLYFYFSGNIVGYPHVLYKYTLIHWHEWMIRVIFRVSKWWWRWKSLSCVQPFATPWTVAMGILLARILEWVAMPSSRGSSWPRNPTGVSCTADRFFTSWATREAPYGWDTSKRSRKLNLLIFNPISFIHTHTRAHS